jgi:hypothetical protein
VTQKAKIHERFRAKYQTALEGTSTAKLGDWTGLRLILDAIRAAAINALHPAEEYDSADADDDDGMGAN